MENETLRVFLQEAQDLLGDLKRLGSSLRTVDIPNREEYARLTELTNKLNRLIGGTASMGFSMFTPLARKTSVLAARTAISRESSIREVILNLNAMISVCSMYYGSLEDIQELELRLADVEKRIDVCMQLLEITKTLDIKEQKDVDDIMSLFRDV
jgi:chemotaxis protein histidine kinase CheA